MTHLGRCSYLAQSKEPRSSRLALLMIKTLYTTDMVVFFHNLLSTYHYKCKGDWVVQMSFTTLETFKQNTCWIRETNRLALCLILCVSSKCSRTNYMVYLYDVNLKNTVQTFWKSWTRTIAEVQGETTGVVMKRNSNWSQSIKLFGWKR